MRRVPIIAVLGCCFAGPALSNSIDPKLVCERGVVSHQAKERLAAALLDYGGVSRTLEVQAEAYPRLGFSLRSMLLLNDHVCKSGEAADDGLFACSEKDISALGKAYFELLAILAGDNGDFDNPSGVADPAEFFATKTATLGCPTLPWPPKSPAPSPGDGRKDDAAGASSFSIRVRGTAESLLARAGDPSFKGADKAKLSLSRDELADTDTHKLSGVVGLGFELERADSYDIIDLVPYLGIAQDMTKKKGTAAAVKKNTRSVGFLFEGMHVTSADPVKTHQVKTHQFGLRPDLTWNVEDDSKLFTLNASWVPTTNYGLNADAPLYVFADGPGLLAYRWVFDLRYREGRYVSNGTRAEADTKDFSRAGGQLGFNIAHIGASLPWRLSVLETYLHGFRGAPDTLAQFNAGLTFYLTDDENAGIELSYVNGRDPDSGDREKGWNLAFGFKY